MLSIKKRLVKLVSDDKIVLRKHLHHQREHKLFTSFCQYLRRICPEQIIHMLQINRVYSLETLKDNACLPSSC